MYFLLWRPHYNNLFQWTYSIILWGEYHYLLPYTSFSCVFRNISDASHIPLSTYTKLFNIHGKLNIYIYWTYVELLPANYYAKSYMVWYLCHLWKWFLSSLYIMVRALAFWCQTREKTKKFIYCIKFSFKNPVNHGTVWAGTKTFIALIITRK